MKFNSHSNVFRPSSGNDLKVPGTNWQIKVILMRAVIIDICQEDLLFLIVIQDWIPVFFILRVLQCIGLNPTVFTTSRHQSSNFSWFQEVKLSNT